METQRRIDIVIPTTPSRKILFDRLKDQLINQNPYYEINIFHQLNESGKEYFWCTNNFLVETAMKFNLNPEDSDLLLFMPDDITIEPNFIEELLRQWDSIEDENKAALSYLMFDKYKNALGNWTAKVSQKAGEVWLTQWVDMAMIVPMKKFIEVCYPLNPIDPARWKNNPGLSSGVGKQISERLFAIGLNMYHVDKSLCFHGDHASVMHPEERKRNPLISE